MRGLSDEYGSWKTMCTSVRSGRISRREPTLEDAYVTLVSEE